MVGAKQDDIRLIIRSVVTSPDCLSPYVTTRRRSWVNGVYLAYTLSWRVTISLP
jgi:hypothetical protein